MTSRRVISGVSGAILVLVILVQPQRFEASRRLFRMEEYGALVQAIRALEVRFPLAPTVDRSSLYDNALRRVGSLGRRGRYRVGFTPK